MDIRDMNSAELDAFVAEHAGTLIEEEALLVLANRFCTPATAQRIASDLRLTSYYTVRAALVRSRATPLAHAQKFIHHLYWRELLKYSTETTIPAPVRRAIDNQMLVRLPKITLGEKITAARSCSRELIKAMLRDPSTRVFEALLVNPRLIESDLLTHIGSGRATPQQLGLIGSSTKWSYRYSIRLALVRNPETPRATAAGQLRFLSKGDLALLARLPTTSRYLRTCIERMM
ncbi:MAG: hypothetical protein LC732_08450 [Acidobacteria bacterium]|nr:hypothetical protein [Acidobacteriota bacterium]